MGAYNFLSLKNRACPHCKQIQDWTIQFKYGDCWLDRYNLYDKLKWGGNDIGDASASIVLVEGIAEGGCSSCHNEIYVRIFIDDNIIVSASLVLKPIVVPLYLDGDYVIIN
jgi:hypothetical protein